MRVSFLGKGGSGKTTVTAAFTKYLSQNNQHVLAIDADLNVHLQNALQLKGETKKIGNLFPEISNYIKGKRKVETKFIGTTPPNFDSQFIYTNKSDPFIEKYCLSHDNISLLTVGTYQQSDLGTACYHGKLKCLESVFHHLIDRKSDWVITDSTAGIDNLGTSLIFAHDLNIFVVEPTEKSIQVFKDFLVFSEINNLNTKCIINKYEAGDEDFISKNIDSSYILGEIPKSKNIKKFEQGDYDSFDDYILECEEVFKNVEIECQKINRDLDVYWQNLIKVHNLNCQSWYNDYYDQKLESQINPEFKYDSFYG